MTTSLFRSPKSVARLCVAALLLSAAPLHAQTCSKTALGLPTMTEGTCKTYAVKSPADSTACHWEFAYRADEAITLANEIWSHIQSCNEGTEQAADQIVNHPDSYAPRTWVSGDVARTVSVKDKAGLNKTLVFLRIEPKS